MKISLAMILWNEAATIERTIASSRSIVDEVVVGMDVTSSDGTREIIERLGCKIIDSRLNEELAAKASVDDDPDWGFSKARNRVFNACDPAAWRLVLDGHELLKHPTELKAAVETAAQNGSDSVDVSIAFEPNDDGIPRTIFKSTRVMAPHVRYVNPEHNAPLVKARYTAYHVTVEHRKRDQNPEHKLLRDAQRSQATIGGFEQQVKDEPKNARAWFYLAAAYRENARYSDAVVAYEECLKFSHWNEERWHARAEAGRCLVGLGRQDEAYIHFVKALDEQPERAETLYYLGDLAYKAQRWHEAEIWLTRCVAMPIPNCRLFLNVRIYLIDRHDLLSMVWHHLGRCDLAAEQAEIALKSAPNARIEKNLTLWRAHVAAA